MEREVVSQRIGCAIDGFEDAANLAARHVALLSDARLIIERLQALGGFRALPGTLNVRLPKPVALGSNWRYLAAAEISPEWHRQTGQAGYYLIPVLIADRYRGLAFQADEPGYSADQFELVSDVHIRRALGLSDGDRLCFSVVAWDDVR